MDFFGCALVSGANELAYYHTIQIFKYPQKNFQQTFRVKEKNIGRKQFLLVPQSFLPYQRQISAYEPDFCIEILSKLTSLHFVVW